MNPQGTQPTNQQTGTPMLQFGQSPQSDPTQKANSAAASLAFATHLQTQMLQHQAPQTTPQTPETAPKTEDKPKVEEDTTKPDLAKELSSFKIEIEGMIKSQIGDLKREIQTALNENPDEQTQSQTNS
jgi:hypothetical protein